MIAYGTSLARARHGPPMASNRHHECRSAQLYRSADSRRTRAKSLPSRLDKAEGVEPYEASQVVGGDPPSALPHSALPATAVHDLVERPTSGILDWRQRAVRRVAEGDQESPVTVL